MSNSYRSIWFTEKGGKLALQSSFAWIIYQQMKGPSSCPRAYPPPIGWEGMLNESIKSASH